MEIKAPLIALLLSIPSNFLVASRRLVAVTYTDVLSLPCKKAHSYACSKTTLRLSFAVCCVLAVLFLVLFLAVLFLAAPFFALFLAVLFLAALFLTVFSFSVLFFALSWLCSSWRCSSSYSSWLCFSWRCSSSYSSFRFPQLSY